MPITISEDIARYEAASTCSNDRKVQHFKLNWSQLAIDLAALQSCRITRIECFRYDDELAAIRSNGAVSGLTAITTNWGVVGLTEFAFPPNSLQRDFTMWASPFQRLKGLTLTESVAYLGQKQAAWGSARAELAESAFMNLLEKTKLPFSSNNEKQEHNHFRDRDYIQDREFLLAHTQAYVLF